MREKRDYSMREKRVYNVREGEKRLQCEG